MVYEVRGREVVFEGKLITVRRDLVAMPDGNVVAREVVAHPGAVGIVAMDSRERVLMLRQYRHPLGGYEWELPAGILDVPGEKSLRDGGPRAAGGGARDGRPLGRAGRLAHLAGNDRRGRARLLGARSCLRFPWTSASSAATRRRTCSRTWVPLDDAVRRVFDGEITNAMAVVGVLATAEARLRDYEAVACTLTHRGQGVHRTAAETLGRPISKHHGAQRDIPPDFSLRSLGILSDNGQDCEGGRCVAGAWGGAWPRSIRSKPGGRTKRNRRRGRWAWRASRSK